MNRPGTGVDEEMKATLIFGVGILLVLATMTGAAMARPELPAQAQPRVIELDAEDIVLSVVSQSEAGEMLRRDGREPVIIRFRGEVEMPDVCPSDIIEIRFRGEVEMPDATDPNFIILNFRGEVEMPDSRGVPGIML